MHCMLHVNSQTVLDRHLLSALQSPGPLFNEDVLWEAMKENYQRLHLFVQPSPGDVHFHSFTYHFDVDHPCH
jgi:hypothetical protein